MIPNYYPQTLRCWSAASSSGKKHSLAMLLMDNNPRPWQIVATDINSRVLAQAQ
ncbi:CheR family methyltransferase [Vibrio metschnikovii]